MKVSSRWGERMLDLNLYRTLLSIADGFVRTPRWITDSYFCGCTGLRGRGKQRLMSSLAFLVSCVIHPSGINADSRHNNDYDNGEIMQ